MQARKMKTFLENIQLFSPILSTSTYDFSMAKSFIGQNIPTMMFPENWDEHARISNYFWAPVHLDLLLEVVPDPHAELVELVPLLGQAYDTVLSVPENIINYKMYMYIVFPFPKSTL